MPPTVTTAALNITATLACMSAIKQRNEVPVVHVDVWHDTLSSPVDADASCVPKLKPVTVTDAPPLNGAFRTIELTTGPSSEKPKRFAEPNTVLTVSCNWLAIDTVNTSIPHCTDVNELHDVVRQAAPSDPALCVYTSMPKLRPRIVTRSVLEIGLLRLTSDSTGESKEKKVAEPVPI